MKNVYYIGRFQFESYSEYKKGLEDVKKIKYISEEVDINEPGVALRLYTLIRQNDIKFQSVIGEDYLLYLSDLVADDYKELSSEEENPSYLANLEKTRSPRKFAGILCIVVAIICFVYFLGSEWVEHRKAREMQELQQSKEISSAAQYIADIINAKLDQQKNDQDTQEETIGQEEGISDNVVPQTILPEYVGLHAENPDMIGWITIPGTEIDYPVMQANSEADPYFYLNHSFDKKEDRNGCIFLDKRNNLVNRDTNYILYGHNMKSGMMFGSLKKYLEASFLQAHPQVEFHTLYEKHVYDIIAVCLAKVEYQDEDGFRYYNFLNATSQKEFDTFKKNIQSMNVYGEQVDMQYGDALITLSTCNNYIEDGRMFLVAKRVE